MFDPLLLIKHPDSYSTQGHSYALEIKDVFLVLCLETKTPLRLSWYLCPNSCWLSLGQQFRNEPFGNNVSSWYIVFMGLIKKVQIFEFESVLFESMSYQKKKRHCIRMWCSRTPLGEDKAIISVNWFSSPGQVVSVGVLQQPKIPFKGWACVL